MSTERVSKMPPSAISGIALVIATVGAVMLGSLHLLWWAAAFAFVVLTTGLLLELRRARHQKSVGS